MCVCERERERERERWREREMEKRGEAWRRWTREAQGTEGALYIRMMVLRRQNATTILDYCTLVLYFYHRCLICHLSPFHRSRLSLPNTHTHTHTHTPTHIQLSSTHPHVLARLNAGRPCQFKVLARSRLVDRELLECNSASISVPLESEQLTGNS